MSAVERKIGLFPSMPLPIPIIHFKCVRLPSAGSFGASWRNGYAEDCKSFYPGSIPGEASRFQPTIIPFPDTSNPADVDGVNISIPAHRLLEHAALPH